MRKKNFLVAALMMAASVMSFTSCSENEVINQSEKQDQNASHGKVTGAKLGGEEIGRAHV